MQELYTAFSSEDVRTKTLRSRVLVVDDSVFNCTFLTEALRKKGMSNIRAAQDGVQALNMTEEWRPDLVLLDLMMPEMDGFEYCKRVRKMPAFLQTPVLVQSGTQNTKDVAKALSAGATDFIIKPVQPEELFNRIQLHLERAALLKDLQRYRKRLIHEMEEARTMQMSLLPSQAVLDQLRASHQLDLAFYLEPSSEVGGDIWGMQPISHTELAVYMVDFVGHGMVSALNTFRLHTLLQDKRMFFSSPKIFLETLNTRLHGMLETGQFATFFYGVINVEDQVLTYASAGAPPFVLKKGEAVEMVQTSGLPLGVDKKARYENHTLDFAPGDGVFLYSDGLVETPGAKGDFFSEEEILKSFDAIKDAHGAQQNVDHLIDVFCTYCAGQPLADDLTLIYCQYAPEGAA